MSGLPASITAQKIASLWLGLERDNNNIDLGQLSWMLDGAQIYFKTEDQRKPRGSKMLLIDIEKYPQAVPTRIGQVVVDLLKIRVLLVQLEKEASEYMGLLGGSVRIMEKGTGTYQAGPLTVEIRKGGNDEK